MNNTITVNIDVLNTIIRKLPLYVNRVEDALREYDHVRVDYEVADINNDSVTLAMIVDCGNDGMNYYDSRYVHVRAFDDVNKWYMPW